MATNKSVAFRIRRRYFDAIVPGDKTEERRADTPYWRRMLGISPPQTGIKYFPATNNKIPSKAVFVCGKIVHRRKIEYITYEETPKDRSAQGLLDIPTPMCFVIHLGQKIKGLKEAIALPNMEANS